MFYFFSYLYQFVSIKYVNMLWQYHFNEEEKLSISKKMKWYAFICFYNHLRVCVCVWRGGVLALTLSSYYNKIVKF